MWGGLEHFYRTLARCRAEGPEPTERFLMQSAQQGDIADGDLGAVLHELGCFYRDLGCYTQALHTLQKAAGLIGTAYGRACVQYAAVLNSLASVWKLLGEPEQAIDLLCQAASLYRRLDEPDAYICVMHNLSAAYRQGRRFDRAIDCLEHALVAMEKHPGHRQQMGATYTDLAALYHTTGRQQASRACIGRALQEYEKTAGQAADSYTAGLNSLAGLLYAQGDDAHALELYQKAARHLKASQGETLDYAAACQHLSWIYERMGLRVQALDALAAAGRVYAALLGCEHERTQAVADDLLRMRRQAVKSGGKGGETG